MFISLLQQRRSTRRFLTTPVEKEKIDILVEAALRAPSSRSFNPWRFIVVTDPKLLEKLSAAKPHGSAFLNNAPLGIVVCGIPDAADTWIEDTSIATIILQLTAESLGLGSCWVQIRMRPHDASETAPDYVRRILNIPSMLDIEAVVAIGYPDGKNPPHSRETLQYDKVFLNGYDQPFERV